jgi:hypothetical protein
MEPSCWRFDNAAQLTTCRRQLCSSPPPRGLHLRGVHSIQQGPSFGSLSMTGDSLRVQCHASDGPTPSRESETSPGVARVGQARQAAKAGWLLLKSRVEVANVHQSARRDGQEARGPSGQGSGPSYHQAAHEWLGRARRLRGAIYGEQKPHQTRGQAAAGVGSPAVTPLPPSPTLEGVT